jgi:hypothetical protein
LERSRRIDDMGFLLDKTDEMGFLLYNNGLNRVSF